MCFFYHSNDVNKKDSEDKTTHTVMGEKRIIVVSNFKKLKKLSYNSKACTTVLKQDYTGIFDSWNIQMLVINSFLN